MPGKTTIRKLKASDPNAVSTRKAVLQTLSASGRPMRARDIVIAIEERSDVALHGKTPRKSIEARIAEAARRGEVKQISRGVYRIDKRRAKRMLAEA